MDKKQQHTHYELVRALEIMDEHGKALAPDQLTPNPRKQNSRALWDSYWHVLRAHILYAMEINRGDVHPDDLRDNK